MTFEGNLAHVALDQNYKVVTTYERRGIKGILSWWSTIKADRIKDGKSLYVVCDSSYDSVIINGKTYKI